MIRLLLIVMTMMVAPDTWCGTLVGELDQSSGTTDDQFIYTLTIQGTAKDKPQFPSVSGLSVQAAGTSQNVSIVNGQMSREEQHQFVITAEKPGQYTIPSIVMEVDGERLQTLPLPLKIAAPTGGATVPDGGQAPLVFLEREVSRSDPYLGEPVTGTVRIYHRVNLLQANGEPQAAASVRRIPIEGEREYQKVVHGEPYRVIEIKEILVPGEAGTITLSPFGLQAVMQAPMDSASRRRGLIPDFFGQGRRIQKKFHSNEVTLNVKPLPNEGRPASFTGLVGQFSLEGQLNQKEIKTGESVTLSLRLHGQGVMDGMGDLTLPVPGSVKVYPDKPTEQQNITPDGGIISEKILKFALVPQVPGELKLGVVEVGLFDPIKGQYEVLTFDPGTLMVTGDLIAGAAPQQGRAGEAAADKGTPPPTVQTLNEDILPLHPVNLSSRGHWSDQDSTWGFLVLGAGMVVFFAGLGRQITQSLGPQRINGRRRSQARRRFLKSLHTQPQDGAPEDGIAHLVRALKTYLGDRFDEMVTSQTGSEIVAHMRARDLPERNLTRIQKFFERIDALQFGGHAITPAEVLELRVEAVAIMEELEKTCAKI